MEYRDNIMSDLDKQNDSNSSTDDKNLGRRKIVKSLVAGGGVIGAASTVDKWAKPVVNSLTLPVHAQTTQADPLGSHSVSDHAIAMNTNNSFDEMIADESLSDELLEFFLPSANAGYGFCHPANCSIDIDATFSGTKARFCLSGATTGEHSNVTMLNPNDNPPTCGSAHLGPVYIDSGEFVNGEWNILAFVGNVSTDIVLTTGGMECVPEL